MKHPVRFTKLTFFILCLGVGVILNSPPLAIISFSILFLILLEKQLSIKIPSGIASIFIGFIIASLVLGSYFDFYERFLWWDDLLHGFYGAAFALVGFILIQYVSSIRGIKNDALIVCLFSLCFSIACGAIWEIYEFAYDQFTGGNMQRTDQANGVTDTMHDIILESGAAFIVNVYIYLYITTGVQNWVSRIWEDFLNYNKN